MSYRLTASWPQHIESGAFVNPETNAEYLAWLAAGNTPDPYIAPPPSAPAVVSRFQAKAALHQAGLLPTIEAYMSAQTTPVLVRLAWADAQEFQRSSGLLVDAAKALGMTDEQLDGLFIAASKIVS